MFFGLRLIGRLIGFVFKAAIFVAAIAAVAGVVAYALFDGEQYKQRLSQHMVDLTGRVMTVNGKAELDLSLPPKIVLNDVRIKNARWGSRADMARIKRVEIQINPLKAISGGDSVAQIRLDGADVMLETNPQGVGNWEMGAFAAGTGAIGALGVLNALGLIGTTSASSSSSPPPVIVSNPTVTFRDGPTGRQQIVSLGGGEVEITGGGAAPAGSGSGGGGNSGGGTVAGGAAATTAAAGVGGAASSLAPVIAFAGGAESSHALAAAASDDTNPCDGSLRQQQAAKPH